MSNIDDFASTLLEEAKRYLELGKEAGEPVARNAHLHASLMLSFCALEAHVNAVADEMAIRSHLSAHDLGILKEREVRLKDGAFNLTNDLKMFRLEDRILYLHARFATKPFNKTVAWWSHLKTSLIIRNRLTHPKDEVLIKVNEVEASLNAIIEAIDALYLGIYGKRFPAVMTGLQSRLTF